MRQVIVVKNFIKKCDTGFYKVLQVLQSLKKVYYKVRQVLQSVTGCYYKVRQVLQRVAIITK